MHYCEQVAKGKIATKNGRQLSELQRFDCRKTVNQRVARRKGATTLYFLLYGLLIDDEISGQFDQPELSGARMEWQARMSFMATAAADIANQKLIIRDLVHFLRCNDSAEVKKFLSPGDQHPDWLEFSICVVVTDDDARAWLLWHKRKIPSWLNRRKAYRLEKPSQTLEVTTENGAELQSLLLGMAVAGYGYVHAAKRGHAIPKIEKAINNAKLVKKLPGKDTIRRRLKEAWAKTSFSQSRSDDRTGALSIVLVMAESHWKYSGNDDQAIFQKISSDLKGKGFFVDSKSIERLLVEAKGS